MRLAITALALCIFAATSEAEVVWDQSNVNPDINALVDQEFADYPTYSSYLVNDFEVGPECWLVSKVTVYFMSNPAWIGQHQGRLNIFQKPPYPDCSFPTEDATVGQTVPITISNGAYGLDVVAANLDIVLDPGHYWIGLTPMLDFDTYGQAWHQAAPIMMCNTAWQNPGGAFGYGADWTYAHVVDSSGMWQDTYDMAIMIESFWVPSPGALALLGLAGLVRRRRR